ncbi:hypothetical protein WS105_0564 [Weissella ceti]|uniref:Uncharacterized protein n=1 Tax=Weissella ceti TaxID=759620 RepID=A0A088GQN4_9LACO|nr:hypothetical protein WS74_0567 [Weissella ceti]AIM64154.1 hypothetical protein WS105_0564 [Weissella ceti]
MKTAILLGGQGAAMRHWELTYMNMKLRIAQ